MTPCRLYLITPPSIDVAAFAPLFARALEAGDVAAVQLRLKGAGDDDVLRAAEMLMPLAHARGAAFLVNDRPDLAKKAGADGVHVGQQDAPYAEARALLGPEAMIGVTCHASTDLGLEAANAGADYVAFGAFHPTATKEAAARADPAILAWWQENVTVPCVAIGGITPATAAPLVAAGADFLAVSSGVWSWPEGPEAAVRAFGRVLAG